MISIQTEGVIKKRISVSQTDSVRDVLTTLQLPNFRIVHNGTLLNPAFSLLFYGITNESIIYIIKPKTNPTPNLSSSQDQFQQTFEQLKIRNQNLEYKEAYKVIDNFHKKFESNPKSFRKIIEKVLRSKQNMKADDVSYQEINSTNLPDKPLTPSTDFLPTYFT